MSGPAAATVEALRFPIVVRDASLATATFLVPPRGVAELLPPGLEPVVVGRRWAVLALVVVDYRDTDLGPYHEVGTCFLVRGPGSDRVGAYVHRLPVDGTFTMEAGRRLWGFPKWLTTSELSIVGHVATCHLMDGDRHVLTASFRGLPAPLPGTRTITTEAWTSLDGVPRRAHWTMHHARPRPRPGGTTLVLGSGHPMADELRALGLPRRAAFTTVVERMSASFAEAEEVPLAGATGGSTAASR